MMARALVPALALLCVGAGVHADEDWHAREERGVRELLYPTIKDLPDFTQIQATFDRGLANDTAVAEQLVALLQHSNADVAATAAEMLGRFPSDAGAAALQDCYARDARIDVRAGAMWGLVRMAHPAGAQLASEALFGDDEEMQAAGLGALEESGDSAYASVLLQWVDQAGRRPDQRLLLALGRMGDTPGSTVVRDRLLAEANDKHNLLANRVAAAEGLESMGMATLVKPILDYVIADTTGTTLDSLKRRMRRLAAARGLSVSGQADVDSLLRDVEYSAPKQDGWERPLRAVYVSRGVFHLVSDGPDAVANTSDDLSTAEAFSVYTRRVFPGLFAPL
jgi:hypothetical protein